MTTGIIVLGCRSGTSALTGVLNILGADVGGPLLGPSKQNPKGFFELERLVAINQQIVDWTKPEVPKTINSKYVIQIAQVLKQFEGKEFFVIKDPRICSLLPFYKKIFEALGFECKVFSSDRPVAEVASSIANAHNIDLNSGFIIAEKYDELLKQGEMFFTFDALINDTKNVVNHICSLVGLPKPTYEIRGKINEFLEPSLKHHNDR